MNPENLAASFHINHADLQQRLQAIGINETDRSQLAELWPSVEPHLDSFLNSLYDRFAATPSIAPLFVQENRRERLRQAQYNYLKQLFCARIDSDYVNSRLKIGWVHYRLQVTPQWYIAAACHFLTALLPTLLTYRCDSIHGIRCIEVLSRCLLFDVSLALQSYGYHEDLSVPSSQARRGESDNRVGNKAGVTSAPSAENLRAPRPTMSRLQLSEMETKSRMDFIGLDDRDVRKLQETASIVDRATPSILQDFYQHFASSKDLRMLVPPERVTALKQQVKTYWQELMQARFDRPYAASRMRIGVIHEEIGLEPQHYLTGLARQLAGFLRALATEADDPLAACTAFVRGVFFDVTFVIDSYMEARAATLMHAEGLAGRVMKGLQSAVAVVDTDQRILYANEKMVTLTGVEPALLRMMRLTDALPFPMIIELFEEHSRSGQGSTSRLMPWSTGMYQITLTGESDQTRSTRNESILVMDDVSRLLRISSDVNHDSEQYRNLIETVPAVLWQMDPGTGSLLLISTSATTLTGLRSTSFLGSLSHWRGLIVEADRPRFDRCMEVLTYQRAATCQYRLQHQSGREIWVQTSLSTTVDSLTDKDVISAITIDISRQKSAEQLRLQAVSQMAAGIAHRLNNALTVVDCNIELHLSESSDTPKSPLLDSALRASSRAATLARQLQAFSGGQILQPRLVSLNQLLHEDVRRIEETVGPHIAVKMVPAPALWMCNVDVDRLRTVIGNLCTNAQQAMIRGGDLVIETRNLTAGATDFDDPAFGRDWIELRLTDSGSGMTDEIRQRAIEPFFSEKPLPERNGLGLSIAHGFMSQSGGHLLIQSKPNQGTKVILRFPRPSVTLLTDLDSETADSGLSILVVDDEPAVLDSTAAILRRDGHRIQIAENAADALQIAESTDIDILLSDISLGDGADGFFLADEFTTRFPGVSVILMSGWAASQAHPPRRNWAFLSKPFTRSQLAAAVDKASQRSPRHP
ncbi:MAG: response regulator [Planctomycetaceae bacterium]|nr:response regulator [Planctomycetaceae bacterium]